MSGQRISRGALSARSGPGPEIRDLRFGGEVLLDGIHATVRGPAWATFTPELARAERAENGDSLRIEELWRVSSGGVDLDVAFTVELASELLAVETVVVARADCSLARAGLCVLHPIECAGAPVALRSARTGLEQHRRFPAAISPWQPFRGISGIASTTEQGTRVVVEFEGGVFETEDHRNWTDAGFKSYSPPLADPAPLTLARGHSVRHRVLVKVSPDAEQARPGIRASAEPGTTDILVGPTTGRLPRLGTTAADGDVGRLRAAFLLVETDDSPRGVDALERADGQAGRAGLPLRITVTHDGGDPGRWRSLLGRLSAPVEAVLVVDRDGLTSSEALTRAYTEALDGVPVGAGTRGYPAEFGRSAERFDTGSFLQLSTSASVHYDDAERMMDTIRSLPSATELLRSRANGRQIMVGPVVLRQRLSVHDPGSAPERHVEDPIARGTFGAAWVLGAVAGLGAADCVALFDASPDGALLSSGGLTPGGRVFRALAERSGEPIARTIASDPRRAAALGIGDELFVANLAAAPTTVRLPDTRRVALDPWAVVRVDGDGLVHAV